MKAKKVLAAMLVVMMMLTGLPVMEIQVKGALQLEDKEIVDADYMDISISTRDIMANIDLPTQGEKGSNITWTSSNSVLINNMGEVNRPEAGQPDTEVTMTATLRSGDYSKKRTFVVNVLAISPLKDLEEFAIKDVAVEDEYYSAAEYQNVEFLLKIDPDRMLAGFRDMAGLPAIPGKTRYTGSWENSSIGGHSMGHYLTGMAQGYQALQDSDERKQKLADQMDYVVSVLKECQEAHTAVGREGFLFGATFLTSQPSDPEYHFTALENGTNGSGGATTNPSNAHWVPWYTTHKIVKGLNAVHRFYDGHEDALEVVSKLGIWIYNRVSNWTSAQHSRVIGTEYGGMNDCLYELYKLTNDPRHAIAANYFDENSSPSSSHNLFMRVYENTINAFRGYHHAHANTQMPKFTGALNGWRALDGESQTFTFGTNTRTVNIEQYFEYAKRFWDMSVEKHGYITGSMGSYEYFQNDYTQDKMRTHTNNESCCAGAMLELTRELYKITGDKKYADYYEGTLRNAVMASVDTRTGGTMYFVPMSTGYFKYFNNTDPATSPFWCCTGSGMEHYTKLGDSIYFHNEEALVVNQYLSSTVEWEEKNVKLQQVSDVTRSDLHEFSVSAISGTNMQSFDLYLRIPDWMAGKAEIKVNGVVYNAVIAGGYAKVTNIKTNDKITICLPMEVVAYDLPDSTDETYGYALGFKYGPTVLAAKLGRSRWGITTGAGVAVSAPGWKVVGSREQQTNAGGYGTGTRTTFAEETLTIEDTDVNLNEFIENINEYMVRDETKEELTFKLIGTDADDNFSFPETEYTPPGSTELTTIPSRAGLEFVPFNTLNDERYGIYWYFRDQYEEVTPSMIQKRKQDTRENKSILTAITVGAQSGQNENGPYELLRAEGAAISVVPELGSCRYIDQSRGYFSYNLRVLKSRENTLRCMYAKEDNGKTMKITIGDTEIWSGALNYTGEESLYWVDYKIPDSVVESASLLELTEQEKVTYPGYVVDKNKDFVVRAKFESNDHSPSARLFRLEVRGSYNNDASLLDVIPDVGKAERCDENGNHEVIVPNTTARVGLNIKIDEAGLLEVGGILVDDSKKQRIDLTGASTVVDLTVYAEDHTTSKGYKVTIKTENQKVIDDVNAVIAKIDAIGTVQYTQESKALIDAARMAYGKLDAKQQAMVTNYQDIQKAEQAFAQLKKGAEDKAAAQPVITLINSIGKVTANSKAKIEAAEKAYGALTPDQKKLINNYKTLTDARAAYTKLVSQKTIPAKGAKRKVGRFQYKITKSAKVNGTVELMKPNKKSLKKVEIPATVKIDGYTFKVTSIAKNAFKKNARLLNVTIGTNVSKIGVGAFNNCKKLRNINIKSKKIKTIGKKAFSGIKKKAAVKVPSKNLRKKYQKMLRESGLEKTAIVK